jgi:hypothetical protein
VSLLEEKNLAARLLMPHELTHKQNRVAIVNSEISKTFNLCKYWTVTFQPFENTQLFSAYVVHCQFIVQPLFVLFSFIRISAFVQLFSVRLFSVFSVLTLELHSRYFDSVTPLQQPFGSQ